MERNDSSISSEESNWISLQRRIDSLENAIKEDYKNIHSKILALEAIIFKKLGSDTENNYLSLSGLDREITSVRETIRTTPTKVDGKQTTSGSSVTTTKRSLRKKIMPKRKNGAIEQNVKQIENKLSSVHKLTGSKTSAMEEYSQLADDKKEFIVTRSGRLSKPNPKFGLDGGKQEMETDEDNDKDEDVLDLRAADDNQENSPFHEPRTQICDVCGKEMSAGNLKAHRIRCHTSSRHWKFKCELCNQTFPTEFKRNYHRKIHTEIRPYKCDVPGCESAFKFSTHLSVHKRVHQTTRKYFCSVCGKSYKHRSGLNVHILMHKPPKSYKCVLCSTKFYTRTHVKRHLRQFHRCNNEDLKIPKDAALVPPPSPKKTKITVQQRHRRIEKVVCEQCGACVLKNNFKHHLSTHEIIFHCDQCGKGFSTEYALKSHIAHAHDLDKPYLCNYPECESRFNSISNLRTHQISHTQERRYRCEPCNRSYKHKGGLKVHINSCHSKDRQFPCSVCSRVFDTRTHLKRHIMKVHNIKKEEAETMTKVEKAPKIGTGRTRIPCDLCSKTYKTKHDLRLHKNAAHTHETQFPCIYCQKVFYRRNHQKRHLQKVHNVESNESSELHRNQVKEIDAETVDLEFEESPPLSTVAYDQIYESYQLKPGTVVEILEYDGEEIRQIEEIAS